LTYRKKLIEVALPLDAINRESAREKSIRHGHPSTLHIWWARRPLAACRAVIFASLVDDPEQEGVPQELLDAIDALPRPPQGDADAVGNLHRAKLFHLIEELVKWENATNEHLLETARDIIHAATGGNPPHVLDPFCGGGSIPLEAQRLGLEAYASDLNPVAVLITKSLIEIPTKFASKPPVNPDSKKGTGGSAVWRVASGLAADVRYYGKWMRDEAWKRIGHLYPKGPNGETIIAWLWARTVKCSNPACGAQMPLLRSFWLSAKRGAEVWVRPEIDHYMKKVRFEVQTGAGPARSGTVSKRDFNGAVCVFCQQASSFENIRKAGCFSGLEQIPIAIVGELNRQRVCLTVDKAQIPVVSTPSWKPDLALEGKAAADVPLYGLNTFADLFTNRQLVALTTFCDLLSEAQRLVVEHSDRDKEYATAIVTYSALVISELSATNNSLTRWRPGETKIAGAFGRQAIPMVWDFAETNPFAAAGGDFYGTVESVAGALERLPAQGRGHTFNLDASISLPEVCLPVVVTDPPYYDNIEYADLADFFYVWLRRCLISTYPDLFFDFAHT
jgi:putative DNA methylase